MRPAPTQTTRSVRRLALATALLFAALSTLHGSSEGQRVWFKFKKALIESQYAE
jgi:hypothetical protein